jgi:hypothetical protein
MTTSFPEGASDLAHHVLRACAGELCPARHSFGGPTLGVTPWLRRFTAHGELEPPLPAQPDGPSAWGDTVLVGVAAPGAARPGSPADTAELTPLAVFDTMTEDQRATTFANTAWLRLMIADVDRDGAPDRCAGGACSPWFSVPQTNDGVGARGLLACPSGYVATGIRGQTAPRQTAPVTGGDATPRCPDRPAHRRRAHPGAASSPITASPAAGSIAHASAALPPYNAASPADRSLRRA